MLSILICIGFNQEGIRMHNHEIASGSSYHWAEAISHRLNQKNYWSKNKYLRQILTFRHSNPSTSPIPPSINWTRCPIQIRTHDVALTRHDDAVAPVIYLLFHDLFLKIVVQPRKIT